MSEQLTAPFPYFGGKRSVVDVVWSRFGEPLQYIEPFCGSAAMLLGAPRPASLEVVSDLNGFIANFWRAVKYQPAAVAMHCDYPVSHVDLGARHRWMMEQRGALEAGLQDPHWPGNAQVAGWWVWGQCAWIGAGWCEWDKAEDPGRGIQAIGQVPHISDAGQGIQAVGQVPHISDPGRGIQGIGKVPNVTGIVARNVMERLALRLERVRVLHGSWTRALNHHYGLKSGAPEAVAVFLDPPYKSFESLYSSKVERVAAAAETWAREHAHLRVCIAGHKGDYDLPGWEQVDWARATSTYGSSKTRHAECLWFSPACLRPADEPQQLSLV